jgi:predicted secreted protein
MAQPTVIPGTKLLILIGPGGDSPQGSPDVFSEPCGLTTKNFNLNASTNATLIPDCANPDLPAWEAKDVNALSAECTGTGVMAVESFHVWLDWFLGATERSARIQLVSPASLPNSLGYFLGSFILSSLKYGGQRGQKVTLDITLVNNGALTFVPA